GQKGVLISGFYKLLVPFTMMIPGVIAFHMYGDGLKSVDLAYPALISDVLPTWMSGFFLAVLLGAVLSSFNSLLNSAATMFALDIYKARFNPGADDRKLISVSKIAGTLLAVVSLCIAPLLMNAPEGLWDLIRRFTGFFNIPIIVILLVGIFTKRVPSLAAKVVIIFHVITYYMLVWGTQHLFDFVVPIHFIHIYAILFVVEVAIMVAIGIWKPRTTPYSFRSEAAVDMVPWKYSLPVSVVLLSLVAIIYVVFSPIGLAYDSGYVSPAFWPVTLGILAVTIALSFMAVKKWNKTYAGYLQRENTVTERKRGLTAEFQPTMNEYQ
ncbi:sodium:solute symporter family transporter, partial [Mesobacillus sp.]|uniref:sodium:solute symporter family transporter n=1 Tax=Mesobacillus sp. TaxID=2675271 RepID=UPI0039F04DF7